MGRGRSEDTPQRGHHSRDAGGRAVDLLLAARHHDLFLAGVHARSHRGATLQAPRVHEDLFHWLCRDPGDHADPGPRRVAHPRQGARRRAKPHQPVADGRLRAGRSLRGRPPVEGRDARSPRHGAHGAGRVSPGERVHAAAERGRDSVHAHRAAGDVRERGVRDAPGDGPRAEEIPGSRERLREGRARRERDADPAPLGDGGGDGRAQAAQPSGARGLPGTS